MGRKHSEENVFRFKSFNERISLIRIGANVKIRRFEAVPEDAETFLGENLRRWAVLNCSNEFSAFESQLSAISESLPLVYLHRQKIAELFHTRLLEATKLSQEALLDLLVHFARDLSSEFVPFAHEFIAILVKISLTNKKDPEVLEWSFSCLAHLMKLMWKFFIEHLESFLDIVLPTFDSALPAYIRQFSAEAFAFLVRKSSTILDVVRLIVEKKLTSHPNCCYGLGLVIFESVKGANKTLLSGCEDIVKELISISSNTALDSPQVDIFEIFLNSCAEHVAVASSSPIFTQLLAYLQSTLSRDSCHKVALSTAFLRTWLSFRGGFFCLDSNNVAKILIDSLIWHNGHSDCCDSLLSTLSILVDLENNGLTPTQCYVTIKKLFEISIEKARLFDFALEHVSYSHFSSSILPHVLSVLVKFDNSAKTGDLASDYDMCLDECVEEKVDSVDSLVTILAKLAVERKFGGIVGEKDDTCDSVVIPDSIIDKFASIVAERSKLLNTKEPCELESSLSQIWAVGVIVDEFKLRLDGQKNLLAKSLMEFCLISKTALIDSKNENDLSKEDVGKFAVVYNQICVCFAIMGKAMFKSHACLLCCDVKKLLLTYSNNPSVLLLAKTAVDVLIEDDNEDSTQFFREICEIIEDNLASPRAIVRETSLHILERCSRLLYSNFAKTCKKPGVQVLSTLLAAERTPVTLSNYRDRLNFLEKIRADIIGNQPGDVAWQRLCVFSLVGQLSIDFAPLHRPTYELLASYVANLKRDEFWSVFGQIINKIHCKADDVGDEDEFTALEEAPVLELTRTCSELFLFNLNNLAEKCNFKNWQTLRIRLWEAMKTFRVEDLEPNSRHFVPAFLDFVAKSFSNILASAAMPLVNLLTDPMSAKATRKREVSGTFRERRRCLVAMLSVFSHLRHRSQLVSADKIVSAVFHLLKLPRPELQRPALDFLVNTNWPGISAYKDMLINLLEPNRYRSSLIEFGDLSVISENDRKNVLPILLRLIFGQMHYSKNKKRSGKSGYAKKSASLAFLSNVSAEEISIFVNILLEPFSSSSKWFSSAFGDEKAFVESALKDGIDSIAFPSTELQFWFFHTFIDLTNNLHNVSSNQWRSVFRIAVILFALTSKVLSTTDEPLDSQHEKRLKRLKKLAFKSFSVYFKRRSHTIGDWTDDAEINAFFCHVIWPEFDRCCRNASSGSSDYLPLINLSTIWASNSGLHYLLLRQRSGVSFLSEIIKTIKIKKSAGDSSVDLKITDIYLDLFESLLPSIDDDTSMETDDSVQLVEAVYAHRNVVIEMVATILSACKKNKHCRKRVQKTLNIFRRVTAHVDDPHCASEVFDLLLTMLSSRSLPAAGDSQLSAMKSVLEVVRVIEDVSQAQLNMIALCFSRIANRQCRNNLCELLGEIAQRLATKCQRIARICNNLNSWSRKIDEPDYESRLQAFSECVNLLNSDGKNVSTLEVTILLNNCLFFLLNCDDFSLRANSSEVIISIINWASDGADSVGSGKKLIINAIVSAASRSIQQQNSNEVVRNEFFRIMGQLVRRFPSHSLLTGLSQLIDDNAEADFFENMRHVQHHRRSRAMRRLATILLDSNKQALGIRPLTQFVLPLAQMHLVAASSGKVKSSVADASLELLRACCSHLPWPSYYRLLSRFLSQLIAGNSEKITFNIRAVVATLDSYHFVSFSESKDTEVPSMDFDYVAEKEEKDQERESSSNSILKTIQNKIIPDIIEAINSQLLPGSLAANQCAIIPLTIAAVKLLIHCPVSYRNNTIPSILLKIIEFLKSRFLEVRQAARKCLSQICLTLGPAHFGWILRDLRISLTRGYQRHVLTYTLGDMVRSVQPQFQPGQLDSCMKEITTIFASELFTVLSEEKEADCKVAGKWPEARRRASLHAYPTLANLVSKASLDVYLQPIRDVLMSTTDGEKVRKSRQLLTLIIPILSQNPGIALADLVGLARRWLNDPVSVEKKMTKSQQQQQQQNKADSNLLAPRPKHIQLLDPKPARLGLAVPVLQNSTNGYVMSEFGLRLLFSLIKHNRLTEHTVETAFNGDIDEIAKFADEIQSLLQLGGNEAVLYADLQLATCLLTFRLDAFTNRLSSLADSVFEMLKAELLQKNTQSRLLVACFKAAGALIEDGRRLDSEQIDALLVCIDEALLGDRQSVFALQLLKKVVDSSLKSQQLPEIINGTVSKTALRGRDEYQPLARACVLSYMLHYPVGQKNLERMLEPFLAVLTMDTTDVCALKSALEMLFLVVSHFPEKELERRGSVFFLSIAALFVNCQDTEVRELVNVVLVRLVSRVSSDRKNSIFKDLVYPWLISGKTLKQQLAGNALVAFVEAEGDDFRPRLTSVVSAIVDLIESKLTPEKKSKPKDSDDENESDTEIAENNGQNVDKSGDVFDETLDGVLYSLLSALVKIVRLFNIEAISAASNGFPQLVSIAISLSLHAHSWIRCQIAYLWCELFKSIDLSKFLKASAFCTDEHKLKLLCRSVINQLMTKGTGLTSEFSQTIAANYVFLSRVLVESIANPPCSCDVLIWFCRRIIRIAMAESIYESKISCVKRLCVFKWMAAFIVDISAATNETFRAVVPTIVSSLVVPLAREISESMSPVKADDDAELGFSKTTADDDHPVAAQLKPVCHELAELFRNTFGVQQFTAALNSAIKKAADKRLKRNAEKASMAVTDPARAARLKSYRQASKREARKRRMAEEKTKRGATMNKKRSKRLDADLID